jgi:hypothetical protein
MGSVQASAFSRMVASWARHLVRGLGLGVILAGAICAQQARADEAGASFYLLGTGGPGAAILPPVQGVFVANTFYYYSGSAGGGKQFEVGGNIVAGLKATIVADFATALWVPTTNLGGGVLALGAILPVAAPSANVSAILNGPLGNQFSVSKNDSAVVVGDPAFTAELGWTFGDLHVTASSLLNVPIGNYREGQLANLAFHRWAGDVSLATTWNEPKSGWDISGKVGFTFNGNNPVTDYTSGTDFHLEGAIEKTLTPAFSVGVQAFYFNQITGDSGPGARLGPFEGRDVGIGGTAAYNFLVAHRPWTLRLHGMQEVDVKNRLQGTMIWLDLTFPLAMVLPTAPPH